MSDVRFADATTDSDFERYATVEALSFGQRRDEMATAVHAARGRALMRVGVVAGEVVAGYALIPVGQFFGGASVPAQAVASVFVHPAWRRRGVAGSLLRDLIDVCRSQRAPLAPLYASTTRLYRRFGWEVCDRSLRCHVRADALARLHGAGDLRAAPPRGDVESLRRRWLQRFDGPLDRPDWWLEIEFDAEEKPEERHEYGWFEGGVLTGHLTYRQTTAQHDDVAVDVHELVAATPEALRGLYGFLGGHESLLGRISFWNAGPRMHELAHLLPDVDKLVRVEGSLCWMERLVDIDAAVAARGWAPAADAQVQIHVTDPHGDGDAELVLEVHGGAARARRGGGGAVRMGIGALSAWYAGSLTAAELARLSLLDGPARDLEVLDSLLPRRPAMPPEHF
jgi:predicted acetyltransferase